MLRNKSLLHCLSAGALLYFHPLNNLSVTRSMMIIQGVAHNAEFSNRSECSLNFLMRGNTAFCRPACMVTSLSFPV
jgi:hypothetical protein